jgi:hypothetical protein
VSATILVDNGNVMNVYFTLFTEIPSDSKTATAFLELAMVPWVHLLNDTKNTCSLQPGRPDCGASFE